ncbi:MAG: type II toxin-antitoxin system PemK/MazF family toxin [Treponema sp.]|nr:type II toxin-antitoxin system PemK/MazF family toxin [Treponema sp.]
MTRGEIWWVDFGLAFGSMTLGRRPAVIVQNDNFNASQIATTIVIPLTTNTLLAEHKDNILLPKKISKLSKDSVVLTPQIGAVDKECLVEKVSKLSPLVMLEISHAIQDMLAI